VIPTYVSSLVQATDSEKKTPHTNYFHRGFFGLRCLGNTVLFCFFLSCSCAPKATECCCVFGSTLGGDTGDWRSRLRSRFFFPFPFSFSPANFDRRRERQRRRRRTEIRCVLFRSYRSIGSGLIPSKRPFFCGFWKGQERTSSWLLSRIRRISSELVAYYLAPRDRVNRRRCFFIFSCEEIRRSFLGKLDAVDDHILHLTSYESRS
jgi:hypothetical protein